MRSELFLECGVWIALQNIFWIGVGIALQRRYLVIPFDVPYNIL